ncbi:hypothetical protein FBUS_02910 [Fasciolopsis buskii]|uniref:Uncharacterized protein n=1 Tax=Fasciolopsis buskii TaxID=27845 RepID=A0A8E0RVJ6_9TREM|nr:hypothetical protein FBUS_02910 [Fasciolopsis buski]
MPNAVGIDLGFTKCCIAVINGDDTIAVPVNGDEISMPSVVAYTNSKCVVGSAALLQAPLNLKHTISGVKYLIGRPFTSLPTFNDKYRTFSLINIENWPYVTVERQNQIKRISPLQIMALILLALKRDAETYLDETVTDVVLAVPAIFTHAQRCAAKDAASLAGFQRITLINESTAAALAYVMENDQECENKRILIFDLGGGKFCASVIELDLDIIEVLSTSGSERLGGNAYDDMIMADILKRFFSIHPDCDEQSVEPSAFYRLKIECEKVKQILNNFMEVRVFVSSFVDHIDLDVTVSREQFEEITGCLWNQTAACVRSALDDAHLMETDLDKIVLVGGLVNMWMVLDGIRKMFPSTPVHSPLDGHTVVACGAAAYAAHLNGCRMKWKLLDCTARSFGIRLYDQSLMKVFPRSAVIPNERTITQNTVIDNQTSILVSVYEGEQTTDDSNLLGSYILRNLRPKSRGELAVDLKFVLDQEGMFTLTATEKGTGNVLSVETTEKRYMKRGEFEWLGADAVTLT